MITLLVMEIFLHLFLSVSAVVCSLVPIITPEPLISLIIFPFILILWTPSVIAIAAEPRQETKEIEKKTTKELNGGDEVLKSPSDVSVEIVNAHDTENTYEEEVVAMDENNEALQSDNFSGKNENIDQDKNALSVAQEGRSVPVSGGGGSSNPVSEILNFDMPDITGFYDEAVYLSLCEKLNALKEKARTYGYSEEIMNEFEEFKTEIISAKK